MSICNWSFSINMDFLWRSKDAAGKSRNATSLNITYRIMTSRRKERMLPGQKWLVLIASNDRRWEKWWGQWCGQSAASTCATRPHIYLVLNDKKDAPFLRHWDVQEMQRKSTQDCICVSVSSPPHLGEAVHNADTARKFRRQDAV